MRAAYAMERCKSEGPEQRLNWCGANQDVGTMCMLAVSMSGANIRYGHAVLCNYSSQLSCILAPYLYAVCKLQSALAAHGLSLLLLSSLMFFY